MIKADGLAMGKGVIIAEDPATMEEAIHQMMAADRFGAAGRRVVIEEFLRGPECSLHAFVDGENYRLLPLAQDFKRIGEGEPGTEHRRHGHGQPARAGARARPGTADPRRDHGAPCLRGLRAEGIRYQGLLFPGLLLTATGPKVLELNARFGDPETQVLLPRLRGDLLPVLEAVIDRGLEQVELDWDPRPTVCVIMASQGYPEAYRTGFPITGLEPADDERDEVCIFHAGTRLVGLEMRTSGGRVLGVTALADNVAAARARAYRRLDRIAFEGAYARRDIAAPVDVG